MTLYGRDLGPCLTSVDSSAADVKVPCKTALLQTRKVHVCRDVELRRWSRSYREWFQHMLATVELRRNRMRLPGHKWHAAFVLLDCYVDYFRYAISGYFDYCVHRLLRVEPLRLE